ncbi:hypothetical protein GIB67_008096 [Kingdonia uniflora]|uniref:Uncharacterized protein n=1 Tax=Kingdonia uniflora TaxID=39325 RepID=A0A7J7MCQ5_9MAGN|nr:hypothetical protein GIB67_008096 [Kingdonia uniflora]
MAFNCFPDTWSWIQDLPPITQWEKNVMSICIYTSEYNPMSLNFSVSKSHKNHSAVFSILADTVTLWSSKSFKLNTGGKINEEIVFYLFHNLVTSVVGYGPKKKNTSTYIPTFDSTLRHFKDIFNLSLFTLGFLICIYEAPPSFRLRCVNAFQDHLTSSHSKEASKMLMRFIGSNLEEQWMRSLSLAITNWIVEHNSSSHTVRALSPLFSYANSTIGLWKVQLYGPVIAMDIEKSSNTSADERLSFSLNYQLVEGVIQFCYKVVPRQKWVDVVVNIDNIRCDVIQLVSKTLAAKRGVGTEEKYFPSRISLQLTPTFQTNVFSVSVSKSSENPVREIGIEKTLEGSFNPPTSFGLTVAAGETMTISLKPWKFEQSVYGYSANLNWFLHDSNDGREVASSKPSKLALCLPNAWFKNRYSSAYRPFTRQGGVVFAGDEYGDNVLWKVDRSAIGKSKEWEIKGQIWITYWPNTYRTFYNETKMLEFREIFELSLV